MGKETSPKLDPIPPFEINIDRDILWRVGTALGDCNIDGLKTNEIRHVVELIAHLIFIEDLGKLCITQHHLCFPYPFFHLVNFPSLRAQVFAHRQAFEALFSACTQFLGALMPSSPTALAATNAAPSTNCPAQTRCAAAACSSSDPGNAL